MRLEDRMLGSALWLVLVLAGAGCGDDAADEMQIYVVESGAVTSGPVATGAGLGLEVVLRVGMTLGGTEQPEDLEVVPLEGGVLVEELGGVVFSYDGSIDPGGSEGTLVRLTPETPGTKTIRFFSDNAVEDPTLTIDARAVDETRWNATVQGDTTSAPSTDAEMNVFVGNRVFLQAAFRSEGDLVFGRERFEVDAPQGSGTSILVYDDPFITQTLDVGDAPHDAVVRSPSSGDTLTVHALDTTGIWLLGLLVDGDPFDGTAPLSMSVGDLVRVELTAASRSGDPIPGNAPAAPTWEIHGASVVEGSPTARANSVQLEAQSAGESTILFQWGDAQAALTIAVE